MNAKNLDGFKYFFWIALVITVLRMTYLFFNHRDLDIEEAQYWIWSRSLAMGYHSKPPMISWAIYFSTWLFGNAPWAVRLFSPVAYFFTALFLFGASKNLYHRRIGFWSGITVLLLPGVTYSATIISTDPFLILFWSMALYAFINACQTTKTRWWALCGLAIGLGLMSKYTMLLFLVSAGLYFICAIDIPTPLKRPGPYLALLIAALIFAPNIIWNSQHHNIALHHVITHNINIEEAQLHWRNLGFFLLSQVGILGPILIVFLPFALRGLRRLTEYREASRLLICFTLPTLIIICGEALLSRAYANWGAVAYPSGVILIVAYMWELHYRGWLKCSVILHCLAALLFYGWELSVAFGYWHWPVGNHPNWSDVGAAIDKDRRQYPQTLYLTDDREIWSKVQYYGKIPENTLYVWDPGKTADWLDSYSHQILPPGKDFIFITYSAHLPKKLQRAFKYSQLLGALPVNLRLLGRQEHIYVFWLQGLVNDHD